MENENILRHKDMVRLSKVLSKVLRHQPGWIGLQLTSDGWANVEELIEKLRGRKIFCTQDQIKQVVAENNKKRFTLNEDGSCIRAAQGHSIKVEIPMDVVVPPAVLYHGTAEKSIKAILKHGLKKMKRLHVHLSQDKETATKVGQRHGKVRIFEVNCAQLQADGQLFYLSENKVWLTEDIPAHYLHLIE